MMDDFQKENLLLWRREAAFGDATALYGYRFEKDNGSVPQIKEARNYANNWNNMKAENLGLLFWGLAGNGKTFAAACIANALIDQFVDVHMCTFGTILNRLPGMSAREKDEYIKSFRTCDLLILDLVWNEEQITHENKSLELLTADIWRRNRRLSQPT